MSARAELDLMPEFALLMSDLMRSVMGKLWESYFPEEGPFSRHLFPKHMEFMRQTALKNVCSLFGGNRSCKTLTLSYIAACLLQSKYPPWWQGRKIERAVRAWVAGQTSELVQQALMLYLFGPDGYSGLIDPNNIVHIYWNPQVKGYINRATVRNQYGISEVTFKSYDQGWQRFQSATLDLVVMDEEPPARIFSECVTRTGTTGGLTLLGFTGLQGLTPLVAHLAPELAPESEGRDLDELQKHSYHCFIGWDDVPASVLSSEQRDVMKSMYAPHELKARTQGIPSVGSGMVYPIAEEEFVIEPFELPDHWPRAFALDPGYSDKGKTAGLWGAWDQDSDTVYLYSEHYKGLETPATHVDAFRRRGSWIPCIIDPAGVNAEDGRRVKELYREQMRAINVDWPMHDAQKGISAGMMEVWSRLTSGRLKVFSTLRAWLGEFRVFQRGEDGKILPTPDHLMDDTRYLLRGMQHFMLKPEKRERSPSSVAVYNPFGIP